MRAGQPGSAQHRVLNVEAPVRLADKWPTFQCMTDGTGTGWSFPRNTSRCAKLALLATVSYAYESTTSRLHSVTDALSQVKTLSYANDDRLLGVAYSCAVNPTPNLAFTWDPYVPRMTSMVDGTGTTSYAYGVAFTFAAARPTQECFVPTGGTTCTSEIDYTYDGLGRPVSRAVMGAGAETFAYDALGRLTGHGSDIGSFSLSYLGQTGQPALRQLLPATSTLKTAWSYLPNSGDRRLSQIADTGLTAGQYTTLAFGTTPENQIASVTETSDAAALYPATLTQSASYNNLNELTSLSGQARTYDLNGNLLTDGQRSYAWDAENRLVGITYPGTPGKATAFTYDGLDRRRRDRRDAGRGRQHGDDRLCLVRLGHLPVARRVGRAAAFLFWRGRDPSSDRARARRAVRSDRDGRGGALRSGPEARP